MKYVTLALMGIGLAIGSSIASGQAPAKGEPEMKTVEQKFAYAYGLNLGRGMKEQGVMLDPDLFAKGIKDGLADKAAFTDQQLIEIQQAFKQIMDAKEAAAAKQVDAVAAARAAVPPDKNLKDGQAFLAANKDKPGVTTTKSGLQYKVLKSGTGKTPKATDSVLAHYRGTLIDGTEFDSSYKKGQPIEFGVTEVIKGWTEALQLMKVGDKWQLFIPSELAYRNQPRGRIITPNSTLIFEIELIDIPTAK